MVIQLLNGGSLRPRRCGWSWNLSWRLPSRTPQHPCPPHWYQSLLWRWPQDRSRACQQLPSQNGEMTWLEHDGWNELVQVASLCNVS